MTSVTNLLQPLLDTSHLIITIELLVMLIVGVLAAFNQRCFLFALAFPIVIFPVRGISHFIPAISTMINNMIIFLAIGFAVGIVIKWIFKSWWEY